MAAFDEQIRDAVVEILAALADIPDIELTAEQIDLNTDTLEALATATNTKLDTVHTDLNTTIKGLIDGLEAAVAAVEDDVEASNVLLGTIDADTSTLALHPYSIKQTPIEATGSAAIATTIAPGYAWELIGFTLKLSEAGGAGSLTLTEDGVTASYDPQLLSVDLTAQANVNYFPAVPIPFKSGDKLDFAWANAGGKTYYLTIWYARRYGDVA